MGKFLPGLFIGTAIGLLIAPKKGEEMRHELSERWQQLQNKLPGSEASGIYPGTTTNDDTDPITLPVDSLEFARSASNPMNTDEISSSRFDRRSTDSASSAQSTVIPPSSTTASISTTTPSRQHKYNDTTEDNEASPATTTTTPVEKLDDIAPNMPS